jgi:serine/threonine protein kinase
LFALWFLIIEQDIDGVESKAVRYATRHPELLSAQDRDGQRASELAVRKTREALMEIFLWFGRYRLLENRPEHQSATCYVYKAMDEMSSNDSSESKIVALKLMKKRDQFIREIRTRDTGFDQEYVVHIIRTHPSVEDANDQVLVVDEAIEVKGLMTKQQAESLYCIVLPFADRNLFASLKQERFGEEEKKSIFIQLVKCVEHLHSKGIVHADIKPLNIIRD